MRWSLGLFFSQPAREGRCHRAWYSCRIPGTRTPCPDRLLNSDLLASLPDLQPSSRSVAASPRSRTCFGRGAKWPDILPGHKSAFPLLLSQPLIRSGFKLSELAISNPLFRLISWYNPSPHFPYVQHRAGFRSFRLCAEELHCFQ